MAILGAKCLKCGHNFYHLDLDCGRDDRVFCPLCNGLVELTEEKIPEDKKWARCVHDRSKPGCQNCQKKSCRRQEK